MQPKKISIIGINGRFGQWFKHFFENRACEVRGCDRDSAHMLPHVVAWADVVIFCVPISSTIDVIHRAVEHSREGQLWMDITSIKFPAMRAMLRSKADVVGLHPLFAPPAEDTWHGNTVAVCSPGEMILRDSTWFSSFISKTGARVEKIDAAMHDFLMLGDQNIPHIVAIATALTLQDMKVDPKLLLKFATKVSRKQFGIMARVLSQDPELYADIQMENLGGADALNKLIAVLTLLRDLVAAKDKDAFVDKFEDAREFLGPEFIKEAATFFG